MRLTALEWFVVENIPAAPACLYPSSGPPRRDSVSKLDANWAVQVEHEIVEERFQQLGKHVEVIAGDTLRFNILNNFTIRQTPDIIAFALRMFYSMQACV